MIFSENSIDLESDDATMKNSTSDQAQNQSNGNPGTSRSTQGTSTSCNGDDNDEEDDVIQKILANTKTVRHHPPDINIDDYVVDLTFHPEEDILAAATMSGDALIYKYSVDENILVSTLELHLKAIRDIEFSHDGKQLYSTSKDRSILLTDMQSEKFIRNYEKAHDQPVSKMLILDENLFATGDDDGVIKLWDTRDNQHKPIFELKEVDDYITAMITNDAKKVLVATSGDGLLTAINIGSR